MSIIEKTRNLSLAFLLNFNTFAGTTNAQEAHQAPEENKLEIEVDKAICDEDGHLKIQTGLSWKNSKEGITIFFNIQTEKELKQKIKITTQQVTGLIPPSEKEQNEAWKEIQEKFNKTNVKCSFGITPNENNEILDKEGIPEEEIFSSEETLTASSTNTAPTRIPT